VDWRLVRQVMEWKRSGRFDDVLEARVRLRALGTTSFTLATELWRVADEVLLVTAETVYVMMDAASERKRPLTEEDRERLTRGAAGVLMDCSGAR